MRLYNSVVCVIRRLMSSSSLRQFGNKDGDLKKLTRRVYAVENLFKAGFIVADIEQTLTVVNTRRVAYTKTYIYINLHSFLYSYLHLHLHANAVQAIIYSPTQLHMYTHPHN